MDSSPVLFIAGATSGLGTPIARKLAGEGYSLVLHTYRNREKADRLYHSLMEKPDFKGKFMVVEGDLSDTGIVKKISGEVLENLGVPYGLLHLAGDFHYAEMTETPSSTFRHILDSNLVSFYEVAHAFLPEMCSRGRGRIIAMGMTGAQSTTPMRACGAAMAAKSGLTALVRTLALEIASSGITANIINPGDIREKQLTRSEARAKKADDHFPMGYAGSFEDLADCTLFLMSDKAPYITGSVIDVSGGWMGNDIRFPRKPIDQKTRET